MLQDLKDQVVLNNRMCLLSRQYPRPGGRLPACCIRSIQSLLWYCTACEACHNSVSARHVRIFCYAVLLRSDSCWMSCTQDYPVAALPTALVASAPEYAMFTATAQDGLARCGLMMIRNTPITTPTPMIYTRRGGCMFLTPDMLEKLRPEAQMVQVNTTQL